MLPSLNSANSRVVWGSFRLSIHLERRSNLGLPGSSQDALSQSSGKGTEGEREQKTVCAPSQSSVDWVVAVLIAARNLIDAIM